MIIEAVLGTFYIKLYHTVTIYRKYIYLTYFLFNRGSILLNIFIINLSFSLRLRFFFLLNSLLGYSFSFGYTFFFGIRIIVRWWYRLFFASMFSSVFFIYA